MFVALDLETTGFDPREDEILEVAAVRFDEKKILDSYSVLVKPSGALSAEISRLTGLRDEDFSDATRVREALLGLAEFVGNDAIIGHNIEFDMGFLKHYAPVKNYLEQETYDSLELARVLLQNEPSYALGQLCKRLDIAQEESHRALPDAKACAELFQILLREARTVPAGVFGKLLSLFGKSTWAYAKFFGTGGKSMLGMLKETGQAEKTNVFSGEVAEICINALAEKKPLVLESALLPDLDILKKSGKPILFAYGHKRQEYEKYFTLHEDEYYLATEKLEKWLEYKKSFSDTETAFFAKLLLFAEATSSGLKHEIRLHGEEWHLWHFVSGEGSFARAARDRAAGESLALCHHGALGAADALDSAAARAVVAADALLLEEKLTLAQQKRFTLEKFDTLLSFFEDNKTAKTLISKIHIVFGLLGMYYEKTAMPTSGGFGEDLVLGHDFEVSKEGKEVFAAMENLRALWAQAEKSDKTLHGTLEGIFREFFGLFGTFNGKFPRWLSWKFSALSIEAGPLEIKLPHEPTVFLDAALSLKDDFSYFTTLSSAKDAHTKKIPHEEFLTVDWEIPISLPEPNSEGYFIACAQLIEGIAENRSGKNTLMLFHTKKALDAHFSRLLESPAAEKINILAYGRTGGAAKITEEFLAAPRNTLIFATASFLQHFENVAPHISTVVFQKIPFEPSFHPLVKLRQAARGNDFLKTTLPKALLRLKRLLSFFALANQGKNRKKVIFLDTRLLKPEYAVLLKELRKPT